MATAQTKYEASKSHQNISEMVLEVVEQVLETTGLTFADDGSGVDAAVTCSQDHWDGRCISSNTTVDVVGGHLRPEEKVAGDGTQAVFYATLQILAGHYDTVLVTAHCQESQTAGHIVENAGFEPFVHRPLGLDFLVAAALQARAYMQRYNVTSEQLAQVVVKNRANAALNQFAQLRQPVSVEEVMNSDLVADPLRSLDIKPTSDGACAILLASEDRAKKLTRNPVWIAGGGSCYDSDLLGDRDLAKCDALAEAAKRAYRIAGVSNPAREVDVAEVSEFCSYQELLWSEGLGLCEQGEGAHLADSGRSALRGSLPINPSGGVLAGNPVTVSGLTRVIEASKQVAGLADGHQVDGARVAVAQGFAGPCGQLQTVLLLRADDGGKSRG